MPVTYNIDADKRTIRTRCVGFVTVDEVVGHFRALAQDPNCPEQLDVFLDLSEMKSLPAPEKLAMVVQEMKKVQARVRFGASAILATSDASFGMMRMFEVLAEKLFRVTHPFRTAAEAEQWLATLQSSGERTPPHDQ
jgi:hypothetical protein